jgi:signal transduction histidine kinase
MRISYKVWLVGGIPIFIAAAVAVLAWMLLKEAERARDGAVLAGTIYRNLLVAMTARDNYVQSLPGDRAEYAVQFGSLAERTRADLGNLQKLTRDEANRQAAETARESLSHYERRMRQFMVITTNNDHLASEMRERVTALIDLTDKARARQRASNGDIVASLTEKDRKLRAARDVVDQAQELRAQIAAVALQELQRNYGTSFDELADADWKLTLGLSKLRHAATALAQSLRSSSDDARKKIADELLTLVRDYETLITGSPNPAREGMEGSARVVAGQGLSDWADRLVKVYSSEQRSLHDEVAQLLTYSVQANETEQATQNIAISTLKMGQRTAEVLRQRNPGAAAALLGESQELTGHVDVLPISPLIQSEMLQAIDQWRDRLATAISGLRTQNEMVADMDSTASAMVASARRLNDVFATEADLIGDFVRKILIIGATIGLLLGSGAAFFAARSITRPLNALQEDMRSLAGNPAAGPISHADRRDELGDMARAANFFVTEISHREKALRLAKEQADLALSELRRTQAELIQAEKLASLGQLVAGVAHEINTPVGIALTTATTLREEADSFGEQALSGQMPRSRFLHFVERMKEGSNLLFTNLTRAADLVHSFKQVTADQVSSDRRAFEVNRWAHELLTSLQPVLRKSGHTVRVECRPDLMADTYPGALSQVLTNLIMNSVSHAYAPGMSGHLSLRIEEKPAGTLRIEFADDGKGIPEADMSKVFDPFYTTARNRGNTGLGLHIVYNLVTNKLHGRIDVESELGRGTRFTICLPSRAAAEPEPLLASA